MRALITGASSGLGEEFAYQLSEAGYDLILVARRKTHLQNIKKKIKTNCEIIPLDLTDQDNIEELYNELENVDIDLVINNAGCGLLGEFKDISLDDDYNMINLNVKAVHYLTKKFYKKFTILNKGTIINVSSTAGFMYGPLFSTYYASKNYVNALTSAIYEENIRNKSNVKIKLLCPGPMNTEFNDKAHGKFKKASKPSNIVSYTLKRLNKDRLYIIPGFTNKLCVFSGKVLPKTLLLRINYNIQKKKIDAYKK